LLDVIRDNPLAGTDDIPKVTLREFDRHQMFLQTFDAHPSLILQRRRGST
jgi:hypothetical protein